MKPILHIAIAFLLGTLTAGAIKPYWAVDFGAVFDNREGDQSYSLSKTYLFTSLAPEGGIRFTPADRIAGGVVWKQPIGCEWEGHRLSPTLYYRHEGGRDGGPWSFSLGMFPRRQLTEEMPGFLWSDSLNYMQNNIRGLLIQYRRERGFADLYLDWRGMQTRRQREAFAIVAHGRWHPLAGKPLFVGGHAMMNHLARQKDAPIDQFVADNFVINPYVGVNLQGRTPLDSLIVRCGPLVSLVRDRGKGINQWHTPVGLWIEAVGEWRWLGLKNSFYMGGRQYPDYSFLGSNLYMGEPFYQAKFYNRTDIYAHVYRNRYMDLRAGLYFNAVGHTFNFSQHITLSVNLP